MIVKRLKEYIDSKGIAVSAFERSIGMSNNSFGKSLKNNGSIGSDKIENVLRIYTDINPEWLMTGKGSMFKQSRSGVSIGDNNHRINIGGSNNSNNDMLREPDVEYGTKNSNKVLAENKDLKKEIEALKKEIEALKKEIGLLENSISDKDLIISMLRK